MKPPIGYFTNQIKVTNQRLNRMTVDPYLGRALIQKTMDIWNFIAKHCKIYGNMKILEIGCRAGHFILSSCRISDLTPDNFTGIDIHFDALKLYTEYYKDASKVSLCDMHHLCFKQNRFDIIIASDVLEHAYDTSLVVSEYGRVLRQGGLLLVKVPDNEAGGIKEGHYQCWPTWPELCAALPGFTPIKQATEFHGGLFQNAKQS